jgi:hypothetical protein
MVEEKKLETSFKYSTAILPYSSTLKLKWYDLPKRRLSSTILHNVMSYFTRVEAGSNTSTVTLRVVRGDEIGLKKATP